MPQKPLTQYSEKYAKAITPLNRSIERSHWLMAQVEHAFAVFAAILLLSALANMEWRSALGLGFIAFVILGIINYIFMFFPTRNYKRKVVASLVAEEHPGLCFQKKGDPIDIKVPMYAYGSQLQKSTEDFLEGTVDGLKIQCYECTFETGGKNSKTKFNGYVSRITTTTYFCKDALYYTREALDFGMGLTPDRLKRLDTESTDILVYAKNPKETVNPFGFRLMKRLKDDGVIVILKEVSLFVLKPHTGFLENKFELNGDIVTEETLQEASQYIEQLVEVPRIVAQMVANPESFTPAAPAKDKKDRRGGGRYSSGGRRSPRGR